jgi:hypothetical protein
MYTVEIWETCGVHSTTTHQFHLLHISIIHHLLHSLPLCHFSTEGSTEGASIYLSTKQRKHQEMERSFGYLVGSANLLLSPYKTPCKPAALGHQASQRTHYKFEILAEKICSNFLLI